jgi:hypothetical protein
MLHGNSFDQNLTRNMQIYKTKMAERIKEAFNDSERLVSGSGGYV